MPRMEDRRLNDLIRRTKETDTTQLVVHRHGDLVWSSGDRAPLPTMSVTKLVVGAAIGRAVHLGLLPSVDEPAATWLPAWRTGPKSRILIRQLMSHTSGLDADWTAMRTSGAKDWLAYALDLDVRTPPGESAVYNNCAVMVLPAVVASAVGRPFLEFVAEELLAPLGVERYTWDTDDAGNPLAMAGLALSARDLAVVGDLLLRRGRAGVRLLDDDWVDNALTPGLPEIRFGLLLFTRPAVRGGAELGCFGHDGYGGQQLWIYPASGLVVARLRADDDHEGKPWAGFDDLPPLVAGLA